MNDDLLHCARELLGAMTSDELSRFISSRKPRDDKQYDPHDCIAAVVNKYNEDFCSEDKRP